MQIDNDIFTKDMARRVYYDLMDNSSGQLPFEDFKLNYILSKKGENNKPLEVDLQIIEQDGDEKSSYYLKYENGFSDYRIIQGNQIIKR